MVRLKVRYVLFEILYPDAESESYRNRTESLLNIHKSSPPNITNKLLVNLIRSVIQEYFGDHGMGTSGLALNLKYFSNKTSTGIIRVTRDEYRVVCAALMLISKIENNDVSLRVVRVSGTIKKCETFAVERNKRIMAQINSDVLDRFDSTDEVLNVTDDEMNQ